MPSSRPTDSAGRGCPTAVAAGRCASACAGTVSVRPPSPPSEARRATGPSPGASTSTPSPTSSRTTPSLAPARPSVSRPSGTAASCVASRTRPCRDGHLASGGPTTTSTDSHRTGPTPSSSACRGRATRGRDGPSTEARGGSRGRCPDPSTVRRGAGRPVCPPCPRGGRATVTRRDNSDATVTPDGAGSRGDLCVSRTAVGRVGSGPSFLWSSGVRGRTGIRDGTPGLESTGQTGTCGS